jgi:hypothetical protein
MGEDELVFTMLVLTEKALLPHDVERLDMLHPDEDEVRLHVCVPEGPDEAASAQADELVDDVARTDFSGLVEDVRGQSDDEAPTGQDALEESLRLLGATSMECTGDLVPADPVAAVVGKAIELDAVEIIVITEPHWLDGVLRRDWGTRIYKQVKHEHRETPVLHFIAGTDQIVR